MHRMFTLLMQFAILLLLLDSGKALSNSTSILPYIIGDVIHGNLIWNSTDFPDTKQLELILSYNTSPQKSVNISFGIVNNTGSLPKTFTPNFTINAQHLLIPNNATGVFILKSSKKSTKLAQYKYLLFQPILLNKNTGFTMNKFVKITNKESIALKGMIVQTIFNKHDFTFNVRLAITNSKTYNIAFNKSLNIISATTPPQKCDNVTIIGSSNVTYCPFIVNVTNQFEDAYPVAISSNYYLLTVTFSNKTIQNSNYFGVNGFPTVDTLQQVFVYSSDSSLVIMKGMANGIATMQAYEDRDMSFTIDGLTKTERIYAVLKDMKDNTHEYIFDCNAHSIGYYDSFGWRFRSNKNNNIVNGSYLLNLYMDYGQTEAMALNDKYMIYLKNNYKFNVTVYNDTSMKNIRIISVKNNGNNTVAVNKGKSKSFEFISAINNGTNVDVYFEQCNNTKNGIVCKEYYPNDGNIYSFEYNVDNEIETINIPNNKSLQLDDGKNPNITTKIVMNITLCDGNSVITTKQNISIVTKSSNQYNNLGEDEIVGIVSGSTIIVGLLIWCLCLRHKRQDDGYTNLNA